MFTLFCSVVFKALSVVPESATIVSASLLSALTTPGDLYGGDSDNFNFLL